MKGVDPAELWTAAMAAATDRHTMDDLGVPSALLMERAALAVSHEIVAARRGDPLAVWSLCGPGNNAGDGIAVARQLHGWGIEAHVVLVTERRNKAASEQLALARALGVPIVEPGGVEPGGAVPWDARAVWVDGLLGTGAQGAPRGPIGDVLNAVANAPGLRVAIDIPSGVAPDTGAVDGPAFAADVTVTFVRSKPGLHVTPGRDHAGRVVIADIGLVPAPGIAATTRLIDPAWVAQTLTALPLAAHKGQRGHVGVVGGGTGTPGAAVLTGAAALRAGAGLVTVATADAGVRAELVAHRPELMITPLTAKGTPVAAASALVVGPGLTDPDPGIDLAALYQADPRPAIWDASALDSVPRGAGGGPRVLTPHPGEAARMLARFDSGGSWTSAKVQADRLAAAAALAGHTAATVVLKGAGSIVAGGSGLAICVAGGPALATAGSGDALAGLVGALLARGLSPWDAAQVAVHAHGVAGEIASRRHPGCAALEIAEAVGPAMAELRSGRDSSRGIPAVRRG